jgi:hypothetical protein
MVLGMMRSPFDKLAPQVGIHSRTGRLGFDKGSAER